MRRETSAYGEIYYNINGAGLGGHLPGGLGGYHIHYHGTHAAGNTIYAAVNYRDANGQLVLQRPLRLHLGGVAHELRCPRLQFLAGTERRPVEPGSDQQGVPGVRTRCQCFTELLWLLVLRHRLPELVAGQPDDHRVRHLHQPGGLRVQPAGRRHLVRARSARRPRQRRLLGHAGDRRWLRHRHRPVRRGQVDGGPHCVGAVALQR